MTLEQFKQWMAQTIEQTTQLHAKSQETSVRLEAEYAAFSTILSKLGEVNEQHSEPGSQETAAENDKQ